MRDVYLSSLVVILLAICGCTPTSSPANNDVVVWISIDGMRGDYVDRDRDCLPTLSKLMRDGAFTRELAPTFPSITFPSHVSQVTGVPVSKHGVSGNTFYDSRTMQTYKYPEESGLIQAEPIWITAARQGVRTAVIQWPMSYRQLAPLRADYLDDAFNRDFNDADRLNRLLQVWRDDDPARHGGRPLRLMMGYVLALDIAGHKYGPDSTELRDKLVETDRLLGEFISRAKELFARDHPTSRDRLWVVLTTDHGMSPARKLLAIDELLGPDFASFLRVTLSGPVANIFAEEFGTPPCGFTIGSIVPHLRKHPAVKAWRRDKLPAHWQYAHPTRTGDVVAVLDVGWAWKSPAPSTQPGRQPVTTRSTEPLGHHGYAVEDDPNMLGFAVFASPSRSLGGRDLGHIDSLQLHPTVARLLGIRPARQAESLPVEIDGAND